MKSKLPTFVTTFEQYTADSIIGQGGTGVVYRVRNPKGEIFAVKLLSPDHARGEKLARFKNELTFCLRNRHPNILTAIDHGVFINGDIRSPFFVMALYEGSLRSMMKQKKTSGPPFDVFLKVLDGIEAAQKQGVVHRDLKPENILVSNDGSLVVIADFGIAHFQEEDIRSAVETKASDRLANFQYASPEQRMRGSSVDQRSDIYSLGLMLNELFTGFLALGTGYARIGRCQQNTNT